jgi:orotidine-5'-phosphate decarboxylase
MHDAKPEDTVRRYAQIAADAGVRSVMCAAADAWVIKQDSEIRHLTVYGTGTRSTGDPGGEHKRIVTPEVALRNGVDFLVIGTPIVKTNDPYGALLRYGKEIALAQQRTGAGSKRR